MLPILSSIINDLVNGIGEISQQLASAQLGRGPDALLTPEETQKVTEWILNFRSVAEACEFETAAMRTYFIVGALETSCSLSSLATEMTVPGQSIGTDCDKKLFLYVTKEEARYYEQDALFRPAVKQEFPPAKPDIKRAGNCLAAELYTASVFHFMRAAERGMRALAWDTRVKFKNGAPLDGDARMGRH